MKFSIRYKILLLLLVFTSISMLIYFTLAIRIFQNDKQAYVFDSSLSLVKGLSTQINSELVSVHRVLRPMLKEYDWKIGKLSTNGWLTFKNEDLFSAISFFEKKDGKLKLSEYQEKKQGLVSQVIPISERKNILANLEEQKILFETPFVDPAYLYVERIKNKEKELYVFVVVSSEELSAQFLKESISPVYLVNDKGNLMFHPKSMGNVSSLASGEFLDKVKSDKLGDGVTRLIRPSDQKEFLLAYSKLASTSLFVFSMIEESVAFEAVSDLIRQSLYVLAFVFFTTLIISILASRTITNALNELLVGTIKIASGDLTVKLDSKSSDEVGVLATNFNTMAGEVSRLLVEEKEKSRMESELKMAQTVQNTLFPSADFSNEKFEISGYYEPASECGGDWWFYFVKNNKAIFLIGDATGHGAPAALITSAARSAISVLENMNLSLKEVISHINRSIYDVSNGKLMMTFCIASLDLATGELTYVNASHEPPMIFNKDDGKVSKKTIDLLNEVTSPRLGQSADSIFNEAKINLKSGDSIFFYTDGIPDLVDKDDNILGERKFLKSFFNAQNETGSVSESRDFMRDYLLEYKGDTEIYDDITYFIFKYKG